MRFVQREAILQQLDLRHIVLLSNLAYSAAGEVLNCNTFDVATHAAIELQVGILKTSLLLIKSLSNSSVPALRKPCPCLARLSHKAPLEGLLIDNFVWRAVPLLCLLVVQLQALLCMQKSARRSPACHGHAGSCPFAVAGQW